jgi:hypothetical protein
MMCESHELESTVRRREADVLRCVAVAALIVSVLAACGPRQATPNNRPENPVLLNTTSAKQVVDAMKKAGLPVVSAHETTEQVCPKLGCLQAVDTDSVKVLKFPTTGSAQKYIGAIGNSYQVQDLVLVFDSAVTPDMKGDYEKVAEREAAGGR